MSNPDLPSESSALSRDVIRAIQADASQDMLFSMTALGDRVVGYQLEIEGVVLSLVCRSVTQTEFTEIMQAARDAGTGGARPASPTP
jgi:hypothetical protein